MDLLAFIEKSSDIAVICPESEIETLKKSVESFSSCKILDKNSVNQLESNKFDNIVLNERDYSKDILPKLLNALKLNGKIVTKPDDVDKITYDLKTNGFVDVAVENGVVSANKPKYEVGSSVKLNLPKKNVWKLDNTDDDVETIDPDNLLDEDDLKKPDPTSLRVCGTTGKRKACKDCSCGLAEELAAEAKEGKAVDTSNAPKSSCGSCYLGDAFRCATCPYLGMPAFKPGEKIQLAGNQLQADI